MKNLSVFAAVLISVTFLGCQDTKEASNALPNVEFYKSIGMQIPVETGIRWMDFYNKEHNIQGREGASPYKISPEQLAKVRGSVLGLIGLAFHHALDDAGEHHFIVVPIDITLSVWTGLPGRVYLDANTNTEIPKNVAHAWATNYQNEHPEEVWFHFFGNNIFDEITGISYFTELQIEPALHDVELTPELLLIIENVQNSGSQDSVSIGGRIMSESTVYDASSPCPPCPVR